MAIASLILTPVPQQEDAVKERLMQLDGFELRQTTPDGEFVVLAEAPSLDALVGTCRELEQMPGVLTVAPSYVTEADEQGADTAHR
ncbi:MAG: chaperone NapD [Selenomonadaceae bacterium]|nr:chaperone NapD [Selenomonadaceae bacterium]